MKRKKSKNSGTEQTLKIQMSYLERNALWIAVDLLYFATVSVDLHIVDSIGNKLLKLNSQELIALLQLTPEEISVSATAIQLAVLHLNGFQAYFADPSPEYARLTSELRAHNLIIRSLLHKFKE